MSKINIEIEKYDIIILRETHLSQEDAEIKKMEKYLQEFNLQHVHNRNFKKILYQSIALDCTLKRSSLVSFHFSTGDQLLIIIITIIYQIQYL